MHLGVWLCGIDLEARVLGGGGEAGGGRVVADFACITTR